MFFEKVRVRKREGEKGGCLNHRTRSVVNFIKLFTAVSCDFS
jgi:hypothetical protein